MPYQLSWYQPERIVLMEIRGRLATAEVRPLIDEAGVMVRAGKPLVHFMLDTTTLEKIESIPEALKVLQGNPPHANMGWMLVIGSINPLVKFFLDFAGMLTHARYRRFDTLAQAVKFLAETDSTLVIDPQKQRENHPIG